VSASSALASKGSGYPIARVTAKIALGMALEDIPVAGGTAATEPALDFIVAKFPRFPFDKFADAPNTLGTQMKATGEVMGIGSNLEECFLKSVRSLETGVCHFRLEKFDPWADDELFKYISDFHDDNVYAVFELLRRGADIESCIRPRDNGAFLKLFQKIVQMENSLKENKGDGATLKNAKIMGFPIKYIAKIWGTDEISVYSQRKKNGTVPVFKMVDTLHTGSI
jgi:carbamoyl-phosphate synthase large subunit